VVFVLYYKGAGLCLWAENSPCNDSVWYLLEMMPAKCMDTLPVV